jgi:polyhydroxybutyrate depolymerase
MFVEIASACRPTSKGCTVGIGLLLVAVWGCSGNSNDVNPNAGGDSSIGGAATGGMSSLVSSVTGGTSAGGGAPSTGGVAATGGAASTGGRIATGGSSASGGGPDTGGRLATGASSAIGGIHSTGGFFATGGIPATGGSNAAGGTPATGGSMSTTGGSASGGAATGGSRAGGTPSTGGSNATGGKSGGSVTCPSPALKAGDTNKTVQVGSDSRTYILHVPSSYDGSKPAPLVVDFHGLTGSGSQEESTTLYKAQTDPEGVVTAYPNGKSGPMGGGWNVGPCCVANVDDVAFAKALVADVEKVACIDTKRVYAVGFSMGGGMTHYLGCHAADVFAAVAPAAFDLLKENVDTCTPSRPITVISFRSTGDTFVDYNGAYSTYVSSMPITFLGAKATFKKWAEINQCTGSPSAEDANYCSTYSSCGGGVQVTLCSKQGGTHEQGTASVGWPLLKKYTLP